MTVSQSREAPMSQQLSDGEQTRLVLATLFACTVRTLEKSGRISGEEWVAELMGAYNLLTEKGGHNLPTMEALGWAMEALQELRKR
jgi:hypothetical protein